MEMQLKRMKRLPKQALRNLFIKMDTLENISPDISKHYFVSPENIPTPEVLDMNFFPKAKQLQKASYYSHGGYVAELNNVVYNTSDGTLMTPSGTIVSDSINGWKEKQKFSRKKKKKEKKA